MPGSSDLLDYDAFGNRMDTNSSGTSFQYAGNWGYQADEDSRFLWVGDRFYDPARGRFLSNVPRTRFSLQETGAGSALVGLGGGIHWNLGNPNHNRPDPAGMPRLGYDSRNPNPSSGWRVRTWHPDFTGHGGFPPHFNADGGPLAPIANVPKKIKDAFHIQNPNFPHHLPLPSGQVSRNIFSHGGMRFVGKMCIVGGVAMDAVAIITASSEERPRVIGNVGLGYAGAYAGAILGTALGGPGPGTWIGGIVGGFIGYHAQDLGNALADWLYPLDTRLTSSESTW